jgi:hypothetical protein
MPKEDYGNDFWVTFCESNGEVIVCKKGVYPFQHPNNIYPDCMDRPFIPLEGDFVDGVYKIRNVHSFNCLSMSSISRINLDIEYIGGEGTYFDKDGDLVGVGIGPYRNAHFNLMEDRY